MTTTASAPKGTPVLMPVGADTWRAIDPAGRALGHIRREPTLVGDRFRAMRFHPPSRAFRTVGEFWTERDAVDSLRYSR